MSLLFLAVARLQFAEAFMGSLDRHRPDLHSVCFLHGLGRCQSPVMWKTREVLIHQLGVSSVLGFLLILHSLNSNKVGSLVGGALGDERSTLRSRGMQVGVKPSQL